MKQRTKSILLIFTGLSCFVGVLLLALQEEIIYFKTPSELSFPMDEGKKLRVGGLVEVGSLKKKGTTITFDITDSKKTISVTYEGLVPDLFKEGKGVVVEAILENHSLKAQKLLAKHDENYIPKEVEAKLKETGYWKES